MNKAFSTIVVALAVAGFSTAAQADEGAAANAVPAASVAAVSAVDRGEVTTVTDAPAFDLGALPGSVAVNGFSNGREFRIDDLDSSDFPGVGINGLNRVPDYDGETPAFREGTGLAALSVGRPEFGELSTELDGANQRAWHQRRSASVRFAL
ncbi:MAG: hypothetical protein AAFX04_00155 [Pseudomonadota bacterium]